MYLFRWMAKKPSIAMCIYFAISAQTRSQGEQIYEKKLRARWLVACWCHHHHKHHQPHHQTSLRVFRIHHNLRGNGGEFAPCASFDDHLLVRRLHSNGARRSSSQRNDIVKPPQMWNGQKFQNVEKCVRNWPTTSQTDWKIEQLWKEKLLSSNSVTTFLCRVVQFVQSVWHTAPDM